MERCCWLLRARRAASGLCPYMLVLELVSPLTTTLQPGHIPSGYRASNCQRGGDGEAWQDGRGAWPHSPLTHLHLSHPLIVFSFLPPSHAGTLSAPAFFSLLNKLVGLGYSIFLHFLFCFCSLIPPSSLQKSSRAANPTSSTGCCSNFILYPFREKCQGS